MKSGVIHVPYACLVSKNEYPSKSSVQISDYILHPFAIFFTFCHTKSHLLRETKQPQEMDHGGYERKGEEMNCNGQFQDKKRWWNSN